MADESKELLHRVLRAMPAHQRIAFLREVASTLDASELDAVFAKESPAVVSEDSIRKPLPIESIAEVDARRFEPKPIRPVADRAQPDPGAMIENQMKRLAARHGTGPSDIRRQFAGCIGLGLALAAVLVLFAVLGKEILDWLQATF